MRAAETRFQQHRYYRRDGAAFRFADCCRAREKASLSSLKIRRTKLRAAVAYYSRYMEKSARFTHD